MKCIITGGAGFIGCNLARHLFDHGYGITALDNQSLGCASNLPAAIPLLTGDIAFAPTWDYVSPEDGRDGIVHLAGASSTPMFEDRLVESMHNNVIGFLRVLEYAHKIGCPRVIYASTSLVYGNAPTPLREDGPTDVSNFYAGSKYCMEQIAHLYHQRYGIDVVGLRLMSIYGPYEDHKGRFANLVSQFLWDVEARRSPVIYGDGTQSRDFTYVGDVVRAIRLILEHPAPLGSAVFNVGTGEATTLNAMLELLTCMKGVAVHPTYSVNPYGNAYNRHQRASLEHITETIGFRPNVSLQAGIAALLHWRSHR